MIHIVYAKMGSGKSSAIINRINKSGGDVRYLYVTPYLKEVERIINSCPAKNFKQPFNGGEKFEYGKLRGLKILLGQKQNVVTTHALFRYFDEEVIDLIYNGNYILVLDEVVDVILPYLKENARSKNPGITRSDLDDLLKFHTGVDEKAGLIKWTDMDYDGNLNEYKILCDLNSLALYGSGKCPLWLFPIKIFKAFRDSFILTYMFNAQIQRYYFDMYGVEYDYWGVVKDNDNYELSETVTVENNIDYRKLIHICDKEKLNRIGGRETDLSKSWYIRNKNNPIMKQLKNNTYNFFKHMCRGKSSDNIWTTFKSCRKEIQGKGYTRGFVFCNMRATNEYRDRTCVAYLMNRYMNPVVKNFFLHNGIAVDEDGYALSEMLQFIWRSAIRDGKEIWVYIPSIRMRNLLKQWIDENSPKIIEKTGNIIIEG